MKEIYAIKHTYMTNTRPMGYNGPHIYLAEDNYGRIYLVGDLIESLLTKEEEISLLPYFFYKMEMVTEGRFPIVIRTKDGETFGNEKCNEQE